MEARIICIDKSLVIVGHGKEKVLPKTSPKRWVWERYLKNIRVVGSNFERLGQQERKGKLRAFLSSLLLILSPCSLVLILEDPVLPQTSFAYLQQVGDHLGEDPSALGHISHISPLPPG